MTEPKRFPFAECDIFIEKMARCPNAKKIFAVGDSWLAAPGGWWAGANVTQRLNDDSWVKSKARSQHPGFNVLSIAKVGCEVAQMADSADWSAIEYLDDQLRSMGRTLAFDAFIVSAGGNDFIPKVRQFVRRDVDRNVVIDDAELGKIFTAIVTNWGKVCARLARWNVPILTNGYGPIIPTLKAGTTWLPVLGIGPWVGPYLLHDLALNQAEAQAVADGVMDRFNTIATHLPGVHYFSLVDTIRAMPLSLWHDEIHFVDEGWEKVAECWLSEISKAIGITVAQETALLPRVIAKQPASRTSANKKGKPRKNTRHKARR
jgi:hypothetical protein